jgi:hypothetical protein
MTCPPLGGNFAALTNQHQDENFLVTVGAIPYGPESDAISPPNTGYIGNVY